jgi:hypothetical protein
MDLKSSQNILACYEVLLFFPNSEKRTTMAADLPQK